MENEQKAKKEYNDHRDINYGTGGDILPEWEDLSENEQEGWKDRVKDNS